MKKNSNSVVKKNFNNWTLTSNKGLANKVAKVLIIIIIHHKYQLLLELYQKELFKQKNEYKLISSTEKLVREIMNDGLTQVVFLI